MTPPCGLQVLYVDQKSFRIDTLAFKKVLDKVADLPLVILSMNGTSREGKSFALNYFIRYLRSQGAQDWFDSELCPGEMFSWRGGRERETQGINLWSEPFILTQQDGRKVAVLLLDCQGLFDDKTTFQENAVIFSLSNLLSSVMIYNVKCKVEENLLHNLQFFSDYARAIAVEENCGDQLPHLTILVRDFEFLEEFEFGHHTQNNFPAGSDLDNPQNYWQSVFQTSEDMPRENQCVRFEIRKNFREVDLFILPHPGNVFLKKPTHYRPNEQFRHHLRALVTHLCRGGGGGNENGGNFVTKMVGGMEVTGKQFQKFVEAWARTCQDCAATFPDAKTIGESTMIMQNEAAASTAVGSFRQRFQQFFSSPEAGTADPSTLTNMYQTCLEESVEVYRKLKKLGGMEIENQYVDQITTQCLDSFQNVFVPVNQQIVKRKEADLMREKEKEENLIKLNQLNNAMTRLKEGNEAQIQQMRQTHQKSEESHQNQIGQLTSTVHNLTSTTHEMQRIKTALEQTIAVQSQSNLQHQNQITELNNQIAQLLARPPVVIHRGGGGGGCTMM